MKRSIREICDNPNFIKGIYNYCDRWCERCAFTSRCANFAIGEERMGDSQNNDLENAEFWENLAAIFAETKEMILQDASELGLDLSNLPEDIELSSLDDTKNHLLIQLCMHYADIVRKWFDEPYYTDRETAAYLDSRQIELEDAVEVIQWYLFQIDVKFRRALLTLTEEDEEEVYRERNGSAKVALIGIDRSLASWNLILNLINERQQSIIEIISLLDKIKSVGEKHFPAARSFIRPGLDE